MSAETEVKVFIALPLDVTTMANVIGAISLRYPHARAGSGRPGVKEMSLIIDPDDFVAGVIVPGTEVDDDGVIRFPEAHRCAATAALSVIRETYKGYDPNDIDNYEHDHGGDTAKAMDEIAAKYYTWYRDDYESA
jgi:hypothetical protein